MLIVATGLLWFDFGFFATPNDVLWLVAGAMIFYGVFVVVALRFRAWRP
jgi:hypothetical protein